MIAVAPGSFQSELGCPGDWDPSCLRSWLQDPDGDGIYSFETTALPAGSYEAKVAINEGWDENYGAGRRPGRPNISVHVPADNADTTFTYNAATHVLTVTVAARPAPRRAGALSHFGLARKDCLGTARNTTSKVWYTVANGVLSDVYYPTIDNTNVETLQYVVTDGSTFTDLQTRDMTYTVEAVPEPAAWPARVTATAKSGKYRIETGVPHRPGPEHGADGVRFTPLSARLPPLRPLRRDRERQRRRRPGTAAPTRRRSTARRAPGARRVRSRHGDERGEPRLCAAGPRRPRRPVRPRPRAASSARERRARPARRLARADLDRRRRGQRQRRPDGARGSQVDGEAVLALGFGASRPQAVATAGASLAATSTRRRSAYVKGWKGYDKSLHEAAHGEAAGHHGHARKRLEDEYYLSANVIKASEDKTFPGAIVASLASPWGQAVSAGDPANTYFGSYREVFARDLYESWTGLVAAGDLATARDATLFLFERQQLPDGSMPRNSLVNGKVAPDSFGTQLDETAYPILMAYQLGLTDASLYADHIKPAANFVAARGPAFGVERWEEQSGFSPSTIAAEIAGLVAAAELASRERRQPRPPSGSASRTTGSARSRLDGDDERAAPRRPYFIRLSKTGDPNAAISYNVGNGGPDARPARGDRRRLPRARAARPAPRRRSGRPPVAAGRRRDDQVDDGERARLAPLQRRRLRRPRERRAAVGAERPGHGAPLAGAVGRARRAGARHRQRGGARRHCSTA